jgi:alpha-2-macroglobulin
MAGCWTKRLNLPVQVNDPEVARISRFDLGPGQSFTFDALAFAGLPTPARRRHCWQVGLARFDAPGLLASLDRYPYGCTEQITSQALPLLYFDQVAQAMALAGRRHIRARGSQASPGCC